MPYQCQHCDFVSQDEEKCPKCGSRMTYTILGGLEIEKKEEQTVKISGDGKPGPWQRFEQVMAGLIWTHIFASALVTGFLLWLDSRGIEPQQLQAEGGWRLQAAFVVIPLLSVALAALVSLRGIYLAQLVGLIMGVMAGGCLLGEAFYFGPPPALWHWAAVPVLTAAAGFLCGFRVAGKLEVSQEVEYKPIDSWDRKAKPKLHYIDLPAPEKWLKVIKGAGFAIFFHFLWWGAYSLLRWIDMVAEQRQRGLFEELNFSKGEIIALALGGMLAGTRTKSGSLQGLRYGLLMTVYHVVMTAFLADPLSMEAIVAVTVCFAVFGMFAGYFGSFAVPATKHFLNRQER